MTLKRRPRSVAVSNTIRSPSSVYLPGGSEMCLVMRKLAQPGKKDAFSGSDRRSERQRSVRGGATEGASAEDAAGRGRWE